MAPKQVQIPLARRTVEEAWTVRRTEAEARSLNQAQETSKPTPEPRKSRHGHEAVEAQLRAAIGAPVKVSQAKGKGKIEIPISVVGKNPRIANAYKGTLIEPWTAFVSQPTEWITDTLTALREAISSPLLTQTTEHLNS